MADITLSPIPYNGGSLANTHHSHHYCELSPGKFLQVAYQTTPAYLFAYVVNTTNLKTGTFSSANAPMRALLTSSTTPAAPSSAGTPVRLWKLSNTRALMLLNRSLYVLEVSAGDDVSIKTATVGTFNNSTLPGAVTPGYSLVASGSALGSNLQGWYVRDNVVYFALRGIGSSSLVTDVRKVVYDPTGDTLTNTSMGSLTFTGVANQSVCFVKYYLQSIPGSTKKLLSARMSNLTTLSGFTNAYVATTMMIDGVTDAVTSTANLNTGIYPLQIQGLVPLSETTILGVNASNTGYFTFNGTAWNSTAAIYTSSTNSSFSVIQTEALDANYFIVFGFNTNYDLIPSGNGTTSVRIVRFVDSGFGQVSTGTASAFGLSISTPHTIAAEQDYIFRNASDYFTIQGYSAVPNSGTGSFQPYIRAIYQPGG